jgi:plastocyanin
MRGMAAGAAGVLALVAVAAGCGGSSTTAEIPSVPGDGRSTATASASAAAGGALTASPTAPVSSSPGSRPTLESTAEPTTPAATATPAGQGMTAPSPTIPPPTATPPPPTATPPAPTQAPGTVEVVVHARNEQFDRDTIRVRAGATVIATLVNEDAGVQHNLTFSVPGLPHGETCEGPCSRTQTFTVPAAGNYFFLCTLHSMFGNFVVEP